MNIYPLTIIAARYGGTYEGAPFIAFNEYYEAVPLDASGDDVECASFFVDYRKPLGRGNTPDEAMADLARQIEDG